jgi:hypothetical protein
MEDRTTDNDQTFDSYINIPSALINASYVLKFVSILAYSTAGPIFRLSHLFLCLSVLSRDIIGLTLGLYPI